jgi:uncharacterized membrane protein YgaE (UPF0421/DUF939 family)
MSPEGKDAVELSVLRIKGNIVGVLVGVLFLLAALENPVKIIAGGAIALVATELFHNVLKLRYAEPTK